MRAEFSSKKGAIGLGLTLIVFIVIAAVVLIIFLLATNSFIVKGLGSAFSNLFRFLNGPGGSGAFSTVGTKFIALDCTSSPCVRFSSAFFWYVDYNSINTSGTLNEPINFTSSIGSFPYTIYNVTTQTQFICANASLGDAKSNTTFYAYFSPGFC
jgi:hypothetical protein